MKTTRWEINHILVRSMCVAPLAALIGLGAPSASADSTPGGPVRLARFSDIDGSVNWRPNDHSSWSQAVRNLPVRQGCQVEVTGASRAELQFDDGSHLRLGQGALVTLTSLYSDADGEFTEITVRDGSAELRLRKTPAVYQIDAPFVSVDASGPARFRVDARNGVQVTEREGKCVVQGSQGKATLVSGNYLDLHSDRDPYEVRELPPPDSFDNWAGVLNTREDRAWNSPHRQYLPNDVAIVSDDLDAYGDWGSDPKYGRLWHPHVRRAGWRPYHDGHWVWVDPFGWTWVGDEPWGWAPYHYGTWVDRPDGWCWAPGPAQQYWSPAVVDYCQDGDSVAWCPLAPTEVRYPPTVSIGFGGGDWSAFFSIGAAACYYPTSGGFCEPRPWRSDFVNNFVFVNNTRGDNFQRGFGGPGFNHNRGFANPGFVPFNARFAAGASLASVGAFGGRGAYRNLPRNPTSVFAHGRFVGAPTGSFSPIAGPVAARRTAIGMTPTRAFRSGVPVNRAVFRRSVFRPAGLAQSPATARRTLAQLPGPARATGTRSGAGRTPIAGRPNQQNVRPGVPGNRAAIGARSAAGVLGAGAARTALRTPGSTARPQSGTPRAPGMSHAQSAAAQARAALGVNGGARRNATGNTAAQLHRTSTSVAARPANGPSARQRAPGVTQGRRTATQPGVASGGRPAGAISPRTGASRARSQANVPAARRTAGRVTGPAQTRPVRTASHQATGNRVSSMPRSRTITPGVSAAPRANPRPIRQQQARPQRQAPVRTFAQPVRQRQAPQRQAPIRNFSPPIRQRSAPPQQQRQAPPQQQRQAPPQQQRQAPPQQQRQAPPQQQRQAPPQQQRQAPPPQRQGPPNRDNRRDGRG